MPTSDWSPHEVRENVIVFTLFYTIVSKMTIRLTLILSEICEEMINQRDGNVWEFGPVSYHELGYDIEVKLFQWFDTNPKERYLITWREVYGGEPTGEGKANCRIPIKGVVHWLRIRAVRRITGQLIRLFAGIDYRLVINQFVMYLTQVLDVFLSRAKLSVLIHWLRFWDRVLMFATFPTDLIP